MKKTIAIIIENQRQFKAAYDYLTLIKNYNYHSVGTPTYESGLYAISVDSLFHLVPHSEQGNSVYEFINFDVFSELTGIESNDSVKLRIHDFLDVFIEFKYAKVTFVSGDGNENPGQVKGINHLRFNELEKIYSTYISSK